MSSDDDDNMFILGGGTSTVQSIYSSNQDVKQLSDSSDVDDGFDSDAPAVATKQKRGRKAKAVGRGKKKQKVGKPLARAAADSVFINDGSDSEDDVSSGSESGGEARNDDDDDNEVQIIGEDPGKRKKPRKATRKERLQRRRMRETNDAIMIGNGEDDVPAVESEEARLIRMKVEAARSAATMISAADVEAAAEAEDMRRQEQAAADQVAKERAAAAAEAQERMKRAGQKRDGDGNVLHVNVRLVSGGHTRQHPAKIKGEYAVAKLFKAYCNKWEIPRSKAVLYLENDVLVNDESLEKQGILSDSTVDMKVSQQDAVSLKVRVGDSVVLPNVRLRLEDPVLVIRAAVARKQDVTPEKVHLELDGEEICDGETGEELALDSGTLIDCRVE